MGRLVAQRLRLFWTRPVRLRPAGRRGARAIRCAVGGGSLRGEPRRGTARRPSLLRARPERGPARQAGACRHLHRRRPDDRRAGDRGDGAGATRAVHATGDPTGAGSRRHRHGDRRHGRIRYRDRQPCQCRLRLRPGRGRADGHDLGPGAVRGPRAAGLGEQRYSGALAGGDPVQRARASSRVSSPRPGRKA